MRFDALDLDIREEADVDYCEFSHDLSVLESEGADFQPAMDSIVEAAKTDIGGEIMDVFLHERTMDHKPARVGTVKIYVP